MTLGGGRSQSPPDADKVMERGGGGLQHSLLTALTSQESGIQGQQVRMGLR